MGAKKHPLCSLRIKRSYDIGQFQSCILTGVLINELLSFHQVSISAQLVKQIFLAFSVSLRSGISGAYLTLLHQVTESLLSVELRWRAQAAAINQGHQEKKPHLCTISFCHVKHQQLRYLLDLRSQLLSGFCQDKDSSPRKNPILSPRIPALKRFLR